MIEPGKLKAYVDKESHNPFSGLPKMSNPDDGEEEMEEGGPSKERGEELLASMGEFGEDLKGAADMIGEDAKKAEEKAGEPLSVESEPSEDAKDAVAETMEEMPSSIVDGLAENIAGKSDEDVQSVAEALCDIEGVPCGPETMAGYLKCAGEHAKDMNPDEEDMDDMEYEESDEESEMPEEM